MIILPKDAPRKADINYYLPPENREKIVVHKHGRQAPHIHVLAGKEEPQCSR